MYLKKPFNEKAVLKSPFGDRIHPIKKTKTFHKGVDLALKVGSELFSLIDGNIYNHIDSGDITKGYGRYCIIEGETEQGTSVQFWFCHLDRQLCNHGSAVKKGQLIALSGNSGSSTGPHLHFEVRLFDNDKKEFLPVDPYNFIDFEGNNA